MSSPHPAPTSKPEPGRLRIRRDPPPPALLLVLGALALAALGCTGLRPVAEVQLGVPADRLLLIDGHRVYVEQSGPADGVPVVLVHGFGSSSHSWRLVAPRLAAAGFRVVVPDLHGFGWSERPDDRQAYSPAGQARMVRAVLDELGIERAHLVGHSFGGGVSLEIWRQAPLRVRSLALVATTLPTISRAPRAEMPLYGPLAFLAVRTVGLTRAFVRAALERSVANLALVTPELVEAYRERLRLVGPAGTYRSLTAPIPRQRLEVDLTALDLPVILIWGEDDRLIPLEHGRRAARKIPGATLVVYPETGHLVMEERPERLAGRLVGFLRELRGSSSTFPPLETRE